MKHYKIILSISQAKGIRKKLRKAGFKVSFKSKETDVEVSCLLEQLETINKIAQEINKNVKFELEESFTSVGHLGWENTQMLIEDLKTKGFEATYSVRCVLCYTIASKLVEINNIIKTFGETLCFVRGSESGYY